MKYLILSDIHIDFFFKYAVEPQRAYVDDPEESVITETLDWMWKSYNIPETEGLILGGDYSNDYLTFSRMIPWLAKKYKDVYLVLGNHDLTVRGATPSKANLQFTSSEQKIAKMKEDCDKFDNIHFLEGDVINGIGGCMGMCDFRCEPPRYGLDGFTSWKRHWYDGKHWRYFQQVPGAIWNHYDKRLTDIIGQQPKMIITHFVPYELGIPFEFRNNNWNYVFYFKGEKFFDMLENDTIWVCGHVHGCREAIYVNSKGKKIHIICNPLAYPGERSTYADIVDYTGDKIKRTQKPVKMEDYVIDF